MKLAGCVWSFLPTPETTPHWDELTGILDDMRSIGFEGVDFLATDESLTEFYSEDCCRRLGSYARSIGLEPNVMVYQAADFRIREVRSGKSWSAALNRRPGQLRSLAAVS